MTQQILYTQVVPSDSQHDGEGNLRRNLSKQGVIEGEVASAEGISTEPGETRIDAAFRGRHAGVMFREMRELFNADGFKEVPFFGFDRRGGGRKRHEEDGYYAMETFRGSAGDRRSPADNYFGWTGRLVKKGTRSSHWRSLRVNPQTVDNPFGNTNEDHIAVPQRATKVRWFDPVGGGREDASPTSTVRTDRLNLQLFSPTNSTFSEPSLLYDLPYQFIGRADPTVWDDLNEDEQYVVRQPPKVGTATVGTGTLVGSGDFQQWQKVFDPSHEFKGDIVLSNAILRVHIDEGRGTIGAERYSTATNDYESVELGSSGWRVFDADILEITQNRVSGQVEFYNGSSGSYYTLNLQLKRGYNSILWTVPSNVTANLPAGLETKLAPIAETTDTDVNASQSIIGRGEARR